MSEAEERWGDGGSVCLIAYEAVVHPTPRAPCAALQRKEPLMGRLHSTQHPATTTPSRATPRHAHLSASCFNRPYVPNRCSRCTSESLKGRPLPLTPPPPPLRLAALPLPSVVAAPPPLLPPSTDAVDDVAEVPEALASNCRSQGCLSACSAEGRLAGSRCESGWSKSGSRRGRGRGATATGVSASGTWPEATSSSAPEAACRMPCQAAHAHTRALFQPIHRHHHLPPPTNNNKLTTNNSLPPRTLTTTNQSPIITPPIPPLADAPRSHVPAR